MNDTRRGSRRDSTSESDSGLQRCTVRLSESCLHSCIVVYDFSTAVAIIVMSSRAQTKGGGLNLHGGWRRIIECAWRMTGVRPYSCMAETPVCGAGASCTHSRSGPVLRPECKVDPRPVKVLQFQLATQRQ